MPQPYSQQTIQGNLFHNIRLKTTGFHVKIKYAVSNRKSV